MDIKYYSCLNRQPLDSVFSFDNNYYEDGDIVIDVVGIVNTNKPIELREDDEDTRTPIWSDFLFNVIFKTDKYKYLFKSFKEEHPVTPFRVFL